MELVQRGGGGGGGGRRERERERAEQMIPLLGFQTVIRTKLVQSNGHSRRKF